METVADISPLERAKASLRDCEAWGYIDSAIDCDVHDQMAEGFARAVLQAIREPSVAMVLAAKFEMVSEVRLTPETPAKAWRKMIDAALSE